MEFNDDILRAAYRVVGTHDLSLSALKATLEAAAPFIAAQALKDHATAVVTHRVNATPTFFEGMKFAALLAMDHAFDLDQQP